MKLCSKVGLSLIVILTACGSLRAIEWKAPGPNIALGKSYKLSVPPNYDLTTDAGDATQLTDGEFAPAGKGMWFFRQTVGWVGGIVPIVVDLGSVQAIGGVGYNTELGPASGIGWPPAILVFVSDDGKEFRFAGDLVALSSKFGVPSDRSGRHFYRTDELNTRGRFVQFMVATSIFAFSDEVEVYGGNESLLAKAPSGPPVADVADYAKKNLMPFAVSARLATDAARAKRLVAQLKPPSDVEQAVLARLEELRVASIPMESREYDIDFKALLPLNDRHAAIYSALGKAYRAAGYPEFLIWHNDRWQRQTPFDLPPMAEAGKFQPVSLDVKVLQNDRRGEVLNIGNFSDQARSAIVRFTGLPGGAQPNYIKVRRAEYIAMQSRVWEADVLPLAEATGSGWKIHLPAGVSGQIWLDFNVDAKDCPAGTHRGQLEVEIQGGPTLSTPIQLTVAPYRLPDAKNKAVAVGVWDYTDLGGCGGLMGKSGDITYPNLQPIVKYLQDSGVSAPWARSDWREDGTFPRPKHAFDASGNFVGPLDFAAFDQWVAMWPDAKYYMIYASAWWSYAGAGKDGECDPEMTRRLGIVMQKWAEHMRGRGIDPARICLLLVDEPTSPWQGKLTACWANAIRKAVPEFKFFVDPMLNVQMYGDKDVRAMMDAVDIITPGTDYSYHARGQAGVDFYDEYRKKGKIMGFYTCAQNPSEGDSIRYYRLQQVACWALSGGAPESWAGYWSFCDVRGVKPWNQLAGCTRDRNWCPSYFNTKEATDGKHWLAIFEGVNDYEYLLTLKKRIAEVEKSGAKSAEVVAARQVLEVVPEQVIAAVRGRGEQEACDLGRIRVFDALMSLGPEH